ncbi:MAG: radical SAM protein [Nanoarchaeota archaeon]|nr:radical SAM protein [Nanoarchaeota archaeon]
MSKSDISGQNKDKILNISEMFFSLQGEGIFSGLPTVFIRTMGCNLQCNWCDTKYAYSGGEKINIKEILAKLKNMKTKRVCITGGEPLLQPPIYKLMKILIDKGYNLSIETNGSFDISKIPKKVSTAMDIKCPSSKESKKMNFKNLEILKKKDQCKFVIKDEKDYNYAKKIINTNKLISKTNVIFIPLEGIKAKKLVNLILKDNLDVRFSLQLHKTIWGSKRRGV